MREAAFVAAAGSLDPGIAAAVALAARALFVLVDAAGAVLGSLAMQVAAVATERADTRSWLTLPANIQLARLPLPPGSYTIKVELLDAGEQIVATREYPGVVISKAHKTYLIEHWVPAQLFTSRRKK